MNRRTVADLQRLHDEHPWGRHYPITYRTPDDFGVHLVISGQGCLIHRVRYWIDRPAFVHPSSGHAYKAKQTPHAECGLGITGRVGWVAIDPDEATFICHKCHAACERYGIDHFNLIPDTGCAATGGERYRPRKVQA